jgi:outer membrane protein assembly factor BamB
MCSRGVCIAASEAPCFAIDPAHDNAQPDDVVASPLKPTWIAQLEGPVYIPIVAGGRVFVATAAQASVRALDLATGQVLWGPIATAQSAMLAYDQGAVVALQGNGHIEGFDAVTGRSLWRTHRSPSGRNQREA